MANSTALLAVQQQVYTTLSSAAAVTNLAPIFDQVPEGQAYPYIEIGHIEETPENTFQKNGRSVLLTLDIYSEQKGNKEVEQIVEQLNILLDDNLLPNPPGWAVYQTAYELGTLDKEFDVVDIRHFIAQFRIGVEAA